MMLAVSHDLHPARPMNQQLTHIANFHGDFKKTDSCLQHLRVNSTILPHILNIFKPEMLSRPVSIDFLTETKTAEL